MTPDIAATPNMLMHKNQAELAKQRGDFPAHNQAVRNMANELKIQDYDTLSDRLEEADKAESKIRDINTKIGTMKPTATPDNSTPTPPTNTTFEILKHLYGLAEGQS